MAPNFSKSSRQNPPISSGLEDIFAPRDPENLKKIVGADFEKIEVKVPEKSKLPKLSCEGPCLTPHIVAVNGDIPDILQRSIVRRHVYKTTKNRWSTAENAPTTEGQTCGIARHTTLVVRGTMFDSPYLGTLKSELQTFAAVHRTFCVHQMCEK